jgi:hypothetical protein
VAAPLRLTAALEGGFQLALAEPQIGHSLLKVRQAVFIEGLDIFTNISRPVPEMKEDSDIFEGKPRSLRRADEAQALQGFFAVKPVISSCPPSWLEESNPLVIADRRCGDTRCSG